MLGLSGARVARGADLAPALKIVVRTRYAGEIESLYGCGADLVVTDEMEASLRLVSVVLAHCDVPLKTRTEPIQALVARIRESVQP